MMSLQKNHISKQIVTLSYYLKLQLDKQIIQNQSFQEGVLNESLDFKNLSISGFKFKYDNEGKTFKIEVVSKSKLGNKNDYFSQIEYDIVEQQFKVSENKGNTYDSNNLEARPDITDKIFKDIYKKMSKEIVDLTGEVASEDVAFSYSNLTNKTSTGKEEGSSNKIKIFINSRGFRKADNHVNGDAIKGRLFDKDINISNIATENLPGSDINASGGYKGKLFEATGSKRGVLNPSAIFRGKMAEIQWISTSQYHQDSNKRFNDCIGDKVPSMTAFSTEIKDSEQQKIFGKNIIDVFWPNATNPKYKDQNIKALKGDYTLACFELVQLMLVKGIDGVKGAIGSSGIFNRDDTNKGDEKNLAFSRDNLSKIIAESYSTVCHLMPNLYELSNDIHIGISAVGDYKQKLPDAFQKIGFKDVTTVGNKVSNQVVSGSVEERRNEIGQQK